MDAALRGILVLLRSSSVLSLTGNLALMKPYYGSSSFEPDIKTSEYSNDGDELTASYTKTALTAAGDTDPFYRIDLKDYYLVQTVEVVPRRDCCLDQMETVEVRVGTSLDNGGNSNPLCGEPEDFSNTNLGATHIFRCELYGRYVNVKKTNLPALTVLGILELLVNKEPTENIALGKPATSSSNTHQHGPETAVDGQPSFFNSGPSAPRWWMVDLGATYPVVKIFMFTRTGEEFLRKRLAKMVITIGDSSVDNGKNNPTFGGKLIHDLSNGLLHNIYNDPIMYGRYGYIESLTADRMGFAEVQFHSESRPHIVERSNGRGLHEVTAYTNHTIVLPCRGYGNPKPYIGWITKGVVVQNRTTDTDLVVNVNLTKGSSQKYECYATNIHGKDLYKVTMSVEARYEMCLKPTEIKDSSRESAYKLGKNNTPKNDSDAFDGSKAYKFFNSDGNKAFKMMTSCPARGSCKTEAPGWLNGVHPKPEDGLVRRTVCFHYDGNCCYESLDIYVMNCPGMFVYKLLNLPFTLFPARYCFEHDAQDEALVPFQSSPMVFAPVGGPNIALLNHMITKEEEIETSPQCMLVCMMNKCQSFNYSSSKKVCVINDQTKDDYPLDFTPKQGYRYYHPLNNPIVL